MAKSSDDADLDQRADHDEQAGEEGQGVPLDLAQHDRPVPDDQQQHATAEQGDDRRVVVQRAVQDEADGDHAQHDHRPHQQPRVGDPLPRVLSDHSSATRPGRRGRPSGT